MAMKKILFLFICVIAGIAVGSRLVPPQPISPPKVSLIPSPEQKGIIPHTLSIPSLNINAEVESVGMDSKGRMDVPKNDFNAAWYNLGLNQEIKEVP